MFKSQAGQIQQSVANGSPPLQVHFFKKSCVARRRSDAKMGPVNSLQAFGLIQEVK